MLGLFAYNADEPLVGVTSLTFNGTTAVEGFDIENTPDLVTISAPNMTECASIYIGGNASLTTVDMPLLEAIESTALAIRDNPALISFPPFPALTRCQQISAQNNTALANIPGLDALEKIGTVNFSGCALSAAAVNKVLAMLVAATNLHNDDPWVGFLYLNGGTNAAPSGQGIADKATLEGRGATVNTN